MAAMARARDGARNGRMGKCKEDGKSDANAGSTGAPTVPNILQRSDASTAVGEVSIAHRSPISLRPVWCAAYTRGWRRTQGAVGAVDIEGVGDVPLSMANAITLGQIIDDITCAANSSVPSWLYVIAFRFVVHPAPYQCRPRTVLTRQK